MEKMNFLKFGANSGGKKGAGGEAKGRHRQDKEHARDPGYNKIDKYHALTPPPSPPTHTGASIAEGMRRRWDRVE